MSETNKSLDIVAVSLRGSRILWVQENLTKPNAEAVIRMAVMRQGVEDRFFAPAPHGSYKEGDLWRGNEIKDDKETQ